MTVVEATPQSNTDQQENFVPSEEFSRHSEFIVNHKQWKNLGVSEADVEEYNSVFRAALTCEGFMSDDSINMLLDYISQKASPHLAFSLPTANLARDALKSIIESYRMSHKRLCILEDSEEGAPSGTSPDDFVTTVKEIKKENVSKA